jgi:hypothetical protein
MTLDDSEVKLESSSVKLKLKPVPEPALVLTRSPAAERAKRQGQFLAGVELTLI